MHLQQQLKVTKFAGKRLIKLIAKKTAMPQRAQASPNGCTAYPMELEQDLSHKNGFQMESFGQEAAGTALNCSQNERAKELQSHK